MLEYNYYHVVTFWSKIVYIVILSDKKHSLLAVNHRFAIQEVLWYWNVATDTGQSVQLIRSWIYDIYKHISIKRLLRHFSMPLANNIYLVMQCISLSRLGKWHQSQSNIVFALSANVYIGRVQESCHKTMDHKTRSST